MHDFVEVVEHDDLVVGGEELDEMAADEAGAAGDENTHDRILPFRSEIPLWR